MHSAPGRAQPGAAAAKTDYRADIDGLRAVAVLSVVLFHSDIPYLSGGFVGVDVFFVISGFLIGRIINQEILQGRFSFAAFYARRARRILPALLGLLALFGIFGALVLTPGEFGDYSRSGIAALLGVGNILFYRNSDYFAPDAHFDPFLMTWSLGVEEQFYVLLPILLLVVHKIAPGKKLAVVGLLTLASLGLGVLLTPLYPRAAFYLLPTRAWELGIGVCLALWWQGRGAPLTTRRQADVAGLLGLGAILWSVFAFDADTPFPGAAALVPALGAAALLASEKGCVNRLLASPVPRAIGLLSYSWYLYHWPFIAITRLVSNVPPTPVQLFTAAMIALVFAALSWRFIEQPFRHAGGLGNGALLQRYAAVVAVFAAVFGAIHLTGGLASLRLPAAILTAKASPQMQPHVDCLAGYGVGLADLPASCNTPPAPAKIALLGDSHAAAVGTGLRQVLAERGEGLVFLTKSSCPAFGLLTRSMKERPSHTAECAAFNRAVIERIIADPTIEVVVLNGYWGAILQPDAKSFNTWSGASAAPPDAQAMLAAATEEVAARLVGAGKKVLILGDVPILRFNPANIVEAQQFALRRGLQSLLSPGVIGAGGTADLGRGVRAFPGLDGLLDAAARAAGASYLPIGSAFCGPADCRFRSDGQQSYYTDPQHISGFGARLAAEAVVLPGIQAILRPPAPPG